MSGTVGRLLQHNMIYIKLTNNFLIRDIRVKNKTNDPIKKGPAHPRPGQQATGTDLAPYQAQPNPKRFTLKSSSVPEAGTQGSWFMMSETFMMFEINLLIQTGVLNKTPLPRILTVTLDINHQQNKAWSF